MQLSDEQTKIVAQALEILNNAFQRQDLMATDEKVVSEFCRLQLQHSGREIFGVLYLDTRHQLIEFVQESIGTISSATVYPREVVKKALQLNAAAVIFTHNHPSGNPDPSDCDKRITNRLISALDLVDIPVRDHIIVSGAGGSYSFAHHGLL